MRSQSTNHDAMLIDADFDVPWGIEEGILVNRLTLSAIGAADAFAD